MTIRESLILGTLWRVLSAGWRALASSGPGRAFDAACAWFGAQWRASLIVNWFVHPRFLRRGETAEPGRLRARCCALYEKAGLAKLVSGSMFLRCFFWCGAAAALAAVAPTMATLGLAMVGCGSAALRLLHEPGRRLDYAPLSLPVWLYALSYLIATLTSVNVRGSLYVGVLTVVFVVFSAALYRSVDTRPQLDLLAAALVTVAAAVSCYGILQYIFKWGYQSAAWIDGDMFSSIGFRVGGTMQNPNMFGQYLTLMIPLGGAKLLSAKGTWRRLYYLACCGVMCNSMILTFSRGAWLGLVFAGAAFFVIWKPRLLFLVPAAAAGLYAALPATVVSRFTSIGNLGDGSTSYRVNIWLGTLDMLRDGYWLGGVGPGEAAFNTVYPFYGYAEVVAQHAHNLFLQLVCDGGIAVLILFLWVLIRFFRTVFAAVWNETEPVSRLLQIAFASGALGFLVQAMTDYSFYSYRVMFLFWSYLALGALSARRSWLPGGRAL